MDKKPEQTSSEGFYFNPRNGAVRRIRSTGLERTCPLPPSLTAHPNSLEIIGCKSTRNPLPPPSSTLVRNQHFNLCSYFGSEIVYPIAEQSDEHQTSHGPDTDLDSLTHISDSDFEETNQGSNSPLIYIKLKKLPKHVPYSNNNSNIEKQTQTKLLDDERNSATSKDALLDNDNSNSSATPEMHDARTDCYGTDNEVSDKKLSECSNLSCSNTSVECDERIVEQRKHYSRRNSNHSRGGKWNEAGGNASVDGEKFAVVGDYKLCDIEPSVNVSGIVRKRNIKRNKKRKLSTNEVNKSLKSDNCSSLVELDLDWLFDDDSNRLPHRKGEERDSNSL